MDDAYRKHCEDMQRGSNMLRDAILAHLRGTCPATPKEPCKLPPDPRGQRENGRKGSSFVERPPSIDEQILAMFAEGRSRHAIASAVGYVHKTSLDGALRRIKGSNPSRYWWALAKRNKARGVIL